MALTQSWIEVYWRPRTLVAFSPEWTTALEGSFALAAAPDSPSGMLGREGLILSSASVRSARKRGH